MVAFCSPSRLRKYALKCMLVAFGLIALPSFAQRQTDSPHAVAWKLKALLQTPDSQIDYAQAKLLIDQLIDPTTDVAGVTKKLDAMAAGVRAMLPFARRTSTYEKVEAITTYLYKPGPWNKHQVFKYDLENDPTGTKIFGNNLMAKYLQSRRGNCVSMPILFLILGQKLGLDVTLSTAPNHVFLKVRDETGTYQNIEATTGGPKKDSSYERELAISKRAIESGVYLRTLTKTESVAVMAHTLLEYYCDKKENNLNKVHAVADLILQFNPKNADAMVHKGSTYAYVLNRRFKSKYSSYEAIPPELRDEATSLMKNIGFWYDKAQALGWQEETKEAKQAYMQMVKRAKEPQ